MNTKREKRQPFKLSFDFVLIIFMLAIFLSLVFYLLPIRFHKAAENEKNIYFADNITPAHQKIIQLFNEKHAGRIRIVPVNLPFIKFNTNERKELLARTLRNQNSRIDVFAVDHIWIPRFAKWAEPLSRYFSRRELDKILSLALKPCYDGRVLVSLPLHIDVGLLYYRRDFVDKLPGATRLHKKLKESITWDEFIQLAENNRNLTPFYVFQGDNYEGLVLHMLENFAGSGNTLFKNGKLDLNQPEIRKSCQLLVDLLYKYKLCPSEVTTFNESASYAYAINNNVPFFRGWPGLLKEILSFPNGEQVLASLDIAALPHFSEQKAVSAFGGWNLMISTHSKKKQEAVEFLKYFVSEEAQRILYETAGYLPVLEHLYQDEEFTSAHPNIPYFKDLLSHGIYRPMDSNYTKISAILAGFLHKALLKEMSVDEALQKATMAIQSKRLSSN